MISTRKNPLGIVLFFAVLILYPFNLCAQAEVTAISAIPKVINPDTGDGTRIIVNAPPAMEGLYVHVFTYTQRKLTRSDLALTEEAPGIYSTNWDGKTDSGSVVESGLYLLRVFDSVGSIYSTEVGYVTIGQPVPM